MRSQVSDYQRAGVLTIPAAADLAEAQADMARHHVSDLLVTGAGGEPAGVISRTDLLRVGRIHARAVARPAVLTLPRRPVGELMTRGVVTVPFDAPLLDAVRLLVERRIHRVFVTRDERVDGVLSTGELLHAVIDARIVRPLSDYMSSPVLTVDVASPLWTAADRLSQGRVTGVVILENGHPVGLFSQDDALAARDAPHETPVGDVMSHALVSLAANLPLHRAAAVLAETRAHRVLALDGEVVVGILTGLDFARALLA